MAANDTPSPAEVQEAVRAGLQGKLPGLPPEVIDWASEKVSEAVAEHSTEGSNGVISAFCDEVEKALRAGDANALRLAMESVRKVAD